MMAQAGIPVPAAEAVFPLCNAFLADIGDAQSIEQNLSTFSAHIAQPDSASRGWRIPPRWCCSMSWARPPTRKKERPWRWLSPRYFLDRRAWCLISTHHTALKVYAAKRPEVLNASVGFDVHTLTPTFELRLGVPGASAGINIAQRLGLDAEIIADARTQHNSQTQDIAYFLDQLHSQLDAVAREREELGAASRR